MAAVSPSKLDRLRKGRQALKQSRADIADIARQIGMSKFHFIREFKAVFGATPLQYRIHQRMESARRMLVDSDQSITDICLQVGYTSLGSFSSLFASEYGLSPQQYRDQFSARSADVFPHCLSLLNAAWESKPQFSRSQTKPAQLD